jgi:hypothetical protein
MKFSYEKQIDIHNPQLPWRSRPAVRVQLSYGDRYQSVMALNDSGAEITLFHISLAKQLGINLFQREATVFGISGELMPVYFQRLKLKLEGTTEPIDVEAAFVDSPGVSALLGQSGFFEHFRICFDRGKEEVEIRATRQQ